MTAWTRAAQETLRLLERQRRCLRSGRRESLPRLLRSLERSVARLETTEPDQDGERLLARLREEATRNAELARARLDGAAAARERLKRIRDGAEVGAYAPSGARIAGSAPAATRDRRA